MLTISSLCSSFLFVLSSLYLHCTAENNNSTNTVVLIIVATIDNRAQSVSIIDSCNLPLNSVNLQLCLWRMSGRTVDVILCHSSWYVTYSNWRSLKLCLSCYNTTYLIVKTLWIWHHIPVLDPAIERFLADEVCNWRNLHLVVSVELWRNFATAINKRKWRWYYNGKHRYSSLHRILVLLIWDMSRPRTCAICRCKIAFSVSKTAILSSFPWREREIIYPVQYIELTLVETLVLSIKSISSMSSWQDSVS